MRKKQNNIVRKESISVIIPALNEEKKLKATVDVVLQSVRNYFNDYEIFIFNDGSIDKTGEIANKIAAKNQKVKVIHNEKPKCLGGIYKEGLKKSKKDYVILVNGKCDISQDELDKIFVLEGKADLVIPYTENIEERFFFRRIISKIFVLILNKIFELKLHYYNHYVLHKREVINSIDIKTDSYAFQAEALIKLIKKGYSYIEVGVKDDFSNDVGTKAFNSKNVLGALGFLFSIIAEFYFKRGHSNNNL